MDSHRELLSTCRVSPLGLIPWADRDGRWRHLIQGEDRSGKHDKIIPGYQRSFSGLLGMRKEVNTELLPEWPYQHSVIANYSECFSCEVTSLRRQNTHGARTERLLTPRVGFFQLQLLMPAH